MPKLSSWYVFYYRRGAAQNYCSIIFQARIGEAEECIDGMNSKAATTEKLRARYQMDLQELQNESERINTQVAIAEKKLQTFDKVCRLSCQKVCFSTI